MNKHVLLVSLSLILLSGCALLNSSSNTTDNGKTANTIDPKEQTSPLDVKKVVVIPPKVPPKKPVPKKPEVKPVKPKDPIESLGKKTAQGKLILGNKEWVYIQGLGINVIARVDTGATTSSVSATNITEFERDGKKWVRFNLSHDDVESDNIELPVDSVKSIRQSTTDETEQRYSVLAWIQVGDLKVKTPFTLVDRSHMEYALILGRSFSLDEAIVDVSREFIQDKVKK